ncbi:type I methionyl aminopeptidase [Pedobacter sp. MC2016-15]|jgi:methionyl aminopeptidase|uniref:type I methionyl aminopeptidase n=1 Tax=Pedobacter sp. MC2016-15 TaxID=2994473 RepID=UPI002246BE6B|nr:type I methionyl aminopeptidase [Pedobacter sp. MC2016-15]MCX2477539.1 type I methionyl aminopeptidase [Pedobacter sp. MC2016-15]
MIIYKTDEEVDLMHISAMLVSDTIAELAHEIRPGITTLSLDKLANEFIRDNGAIPSFLNYEGYPFHICTSINDVIAHGRPSERVLREGDILSIDTGVIKNEFHGNHAYTFIIGETSQEILTLVRTVKDSLTLGIKEAITGQNLGEISSAIQHYNERRGYGISRELGGHAIGRSMDELPPMPNFGRRVDGIEMRSNLVLAIEPMVNLGTAAIIEDEDGSFRTADGMVAVHFSHNVCTKPVAALVLSDYHGIEEAEKYNPHLNTSYDE